MDHQCPNPSSTNIPSIFDIIAACTCSTFILFLLYQISRTLVYNNKTRAKKESYAHTSDPHRTLLAEYLPNASAYYYMPFFANSLLNKEEFVASLLQLHDAPLKGYVLLRKGLNGGRNWKKRFITLDKLSVLCIFPNAETANKNLNIKNYFKVFAVKPANAILMERNTLEIRGTLGERYFLRAENEMALCKWLCVFTKRAIQASESIETIKHFASASAPLIVTKNLPKQYCDENGNTCAVLQSHDLMIDLKELRYLKDAALRQFYFVIEFRSEIHSHRELPVEQTVPTSSENGFIVWQERLHWQFKDHLCTDCEECAGALADQGKPVVHTASFCGLPEIVRFTLHEIRLRCLTTKIGTLDIPLHEILRFGGLQRSELQFSWPVISCNGDFETIGQVAVQFSYTVSCEKDESGKSFERRESALSTVQIKPFIVTNEQLLERIGEYRLSGLVMDCRQIFDLFYRTEKDTAIQKRWENFRLARGDTEFEVGDWNVSKEHGGFIRISSFRGLTNATIGPSSTMCTLTELIVPTILDRDIDFSAIQALTTSQIEEQAKLAIDPQKLILQSKIVLHDIPYGDCFSVEKIIQFELSKAENIVIGKVYLGIPFTKGCLFKSKIISSTRESVQAANVLQFDEWNKVLQSESENGGLPDQSSRTHLKPFLMSNASERHFVGEYPMPKELNACAKVYAFFYANHTEDRMEELHQTLGETEVQINLWEISREYGGIVRTIKLRSLTHAPIGPSSTRATTTQFIPIPPQYILRENFLEQDVLSALTAMNKMDIEIITEVHDVPYHNCFTAEQHLSFQVTAHGILKVQVHAAVPFTKSTVFKNKIVNSFRDAMQNANAKLFQHMQTYIERFVSENGVSKLDSLLTEATFAPSESDMKRSSLQRKEPMYAESEEDKANGKNCKLKRGKKKRHVTRSDTSITLSKDAFAMTNNATPAEIGDSRIENLESRKLVRLNSTLDGTVALEEIFENQRMSLFGKWGPNHLLPTDRARFTNRSGNIELSFEQIRLPPNWVWTTPWRIDKSYTDCDGEGWSYATDFPRFKNHLAKGKSSVKKLGAYVRRRRWIRMMAYVPPLSEKEPSENVRSNLTETIGVLHSDTLNINSEFQ